MFPLCSPDHPDPHHFSHAHDHPPTAYALVLQKYRVGALADAVSRTSSSVPLKYVKDSCFWKVTEAFSTPRPNSFAACLATMKWVGVPLLQVQTYAWTLMWAGDHGESQVLKLQTFHTHDCLLLQLSHSQLTHWLLAKCAPVSARLTGFVSVRASQTYLATALAA